MPRVHCKRAAVIASRTEIDAPKRSRRTTTNSIIFIAMSGAITCTTVLWLRGDETRAQRRGTAGGFCRRQSADQTRRARLRYRVRLWGHVAPAGGTRRGGDRDDDFARAIRVRGEAAGGESNPRFVLGDWLENDLPAESFDAAIAIESSEHMPDLAQFFEQAHRVLRAEGRLVVCAWLSADEPGSASKKWLLEPICREGRMPQMGTVTDYRTLGEKAGFRLAEVEDMTQKVVRTWSAIVRRLVGKLASNPRYLRFLVSRHAHNNVFALTILRIWMAYRIGAMRYGVFTFVKI